MKLLDRFLTSKWLAPVLFASLLAAITRAQPAKDAKTNPPPPATYPGLPSETPDKFEPVTDSPDYVKRDEKIPMRDGVKLHTVILVPKGAKGAPILLTRTPYNATEVIVEGGYVMNRPLRGPLNPTPVDHASDAGAQTFVTNIFWAKPEDYRKAGQRVYHAPGRSSFVELPLVTLP